MNQTEKNDLRGYAYIRSRILHEGVMPSLRDISNALGFKSRNSANRLLERLAKRGLIKTTSEGISLSRRQPIGIHERTVSVPLVGSVACGLPSLAEQDPEALIQVSTKLAKPGNIYFLLRAIGKSMNKSGIDHGDLVLVRQQSTAEEGDRVVALINDEATIKHFHKDGGLVILQPNSTETVHRPIVLSDDFIIQGVVESVLPKNVI